jgi:hypothetical protein
MQSLCREDFGLFAMLQFWLMSRENRMSIQPPPPPTPLQSRPVKHSRFSRRSIICFIVAGAWTIFVVAIVVLNVVFTDWDNLKYAPGMVQDMWFWQTFTFPFLVWLFAIIPFVITGIVFLRVDE